MSCECRQNPPKPGEAAPKQKGGQKTKSVDPDQEKKRFQTWNRTHEPDGRKKPGVYIAPAGISINELIREYCDGMMSGHKFYGFFPGGASGGILPASLGDVPLDFDTLQEYGCFIGSAAVIVFSKS